jgi:hypothetical protein
MTWLQQGKEDHVAIMATVGHVCVHWALLELNLLTLLAAVENIHLDEAALLFGGLDMRQRLCKAIDVAEYHKIKPSLTKRLRVLRRAIDKKKIVDRRETARFTASRKLRTSRTTSFFPCRA